MVFFFQHYVLFSKNNKLISSGKCQPHEVLNHVSQREISILGETNLNTLKKVLSLADEESGDGSNKTTPKKLSSCNSMRRLQNIDQINKDFMKGLSKEQNAKSGVDFNDIHKVRSNMKKMNSDDAKDRNKIIVNGYYSNTKEIDSAKI